MKWLVGYADISPLNHLTEWTGIVQLLTSALAVGLSMGIKTLHQKAQACSEENGLRPDAIGTNLNSVLPIGI